MVFTINRDYFLSSLRRMDNVMRRQHALCNSIAMAKAAFSKSDLNVRKKLMKCYIWNIAIYGVEAWTLFGKSIRNTLKDFKCGAGEEWIRSLVPIMLKTKMYGIESRRKGRCYIH
jgi:hypothetical protein